MTNTILSSDTKHPLYHTFYHPTSDVKATLLMLHGMAEHSGRYAKFAQYLADSGIAVLTYDHLGHGMTAQNENELGYFEKNYPAQTLLKDVIIMKAALKAAYPDVPQFALGHSMGSFILRTVLQHYSHELNGAILMGTSDTDPLVKVFLPISKLLNKVKPKMGNGLFANTTNTILNAKLKERDSKSQFAWVCKNKDSLTAYENDPLCGFDFTNNGYYGLFYLMNQGLAKNWAQTIDSTFAMLFVSGQDDPVGNMGKGIDALTNRMRDVQGFTNIQKKLYTNMRHEPLHETNNEMVYHDILAWLLEQIK